VETWVGVLIVLLGVGAGVLRLRQRSGHSSVESLAALPFTANPGQGTDEYLGDGITEGVINDLSQVSALGVMARTTVFRFKGKESDPQQVGATLKVDAVVTGHIVQHGDDLTIQAELVRVSDGTQIWGQQFTRKMKDVSSLQGDKALQLDPLSEVINTNLGVELMIAKRFDEAREQFRKTLEFDPKFGAVCGVGGVSG